MNIYSVLTYVYLIAMAVAFISSLLPNRLDLPLHLKIFSFLLGLTLLVECFITFAVRPLHMKNNGIVYNSFMLVEFMAYAAFYHLIIFSPKIKKLIAAFYFLFPVFWGIAVFLIFGYKEWNSYVFIAGGVFTVCLSLMYYYQLFTYAELVRLDRNPEFWIATGLIIFYTCNLPYFGTLHYLAKNFLPLARVFLIVSKILVILMYSIFAYAYICQIKIPSKKS